MAKTLGNHIKAWIRATSVDEIEVFTWLGGEQSNSVNRTAEAVEVSDKSNDWAQFIAGKKGATIEITVFAEPPDYSFCAHVDFEKSREIARVYVDDAVFLIHRDAVRVGPVEPDIAAGVFRTVWFFKIITVIPAPKLVI